MQRFNIRWRFDACKISTPLTLTLSAPRHPPTPNVLTSIAFNTDRSKVVVLVLFIPYMALWLHATRLFLFFVLFGVVLLYLVALWLPCWGRESSLLCCLAALLFFFFFFFFVAFFIFSLWLFLLSVFISLLYLLVSTVCYFLGLWLLLESSILFSSNLYVASDEWRLKVHSCWHIDINLIQQIIINQ